MLLQDFKLFGWYLKKMNLVIQLKLFLTVFGQKYVHFLDVNSWHKALCSVIKFSAKFMDSWLRLAALLICFITFTSFFFNKFSYFSPFQALIWVKSNKPYMILKALFKAFPMTFSEFFIFCSLKSYTSMYASNELKNQVFWCFWG